MAFDPSAEKISWFIGRVSAGLRAQKTQNPKVCPRAEKGTKPVKVGYSASNEGSTIAVGRLPVFTGNESSDRKSDIISRNFVKNYICPEIFRSLDHFF